MAKSTGAARCHSTESSGSEARHSLRSELGGVSDVEDPSLEHPMEGISNHQPNEAESAELCLTCCTE